MATVDTVKGLRPCRIVAGGNYVKGYVDHGRERARYAGFGVGYRGRAHGKCCPVAYKNSHRGYNYEEGYSG